MTYSKVGICVSGLLYSTVFICLFTFVPLSSISALYEKTKSSKFLVFGFILICWFTIKVIRWVTRSDRSTSFKITNVDIAFSMLIGFITVNRYVIQQESGYSLKYLELFGLTILYLALRTINPKYYIFAFLAVISGGIIQSIYGNLQLHNLIEINGMFVVTGSFFNPAPFAGYLASVFPVAFGLYLSNQNNKHVPGILSKNCTNNQFQSMLIKWLPVIGVITTLTILLPTQSRAAVLAIIAPSFYLLSKSQFKSLNTYQNMFSGIAKRYLISGITIIVIAFGLALYLAKKNSSDGRILIWKTSLKIIKDNPVTGIGYDRFKAKYMDYQGFFFRNNSNSQYEVLADNVMYAYNEVLQFVCENGAIGALLFVFLLISLRDTNVFASHPYVIVCWGGLISIFTFSFFSYSSEILPIKMNGILFLSVLSNYQSFRIVTFPRIRLHRVLVAFTRVILAMVFIVILFYTACGLKDLFEGYRFRKVAESKYSFGKNKDALSQLLQASRYFSQDGEFLTLYGKVLSSDGQTKKSTAILKYAQHLKNSTVLQTTLGDNYKYLKQYDLAEKAYFSAHYMVPNKFYPLYLLAILYQEQGQTDKANMMALAVLKKSVKIKSKAIEEMKHEMHNILKKNAN